jgi:hypothetical protein
MFKQQQNVVYLQTTSGRSFSTWVAQNVEILIMFYRLLLRSNYTTSSHYTTTKCIILMNKASQGTYFYHNALQRKLVTIMLGSLGFIFNGNR